MNNADSYDTTIYLLNEIAEFLEGQSDVRDGSYGEQIPNRAMSLLQQVDIEIERLKHAAPQVPVSASLGSVPSEDPGSSLCGESRLSDCGNRNGPVDCPAVAAPAYDATLESEK